MNTPNDAPLSERLDEMLSRVILGDDEQTLIAARDLARRVEGAPVAIMDTRDVLGICAPTEEEFPALYALQGMRVKLVPCNE